MDSATTPEHDVRDRLASSLQELVDDAEALLKSAQHNGSEQFAAARDKVQTRLRHARSELAALEDAASYNVRRAARVADTAMHDHPYAAAGLAAGVGVLIGMLISRR
jgi:ElaB/YqjD/DUF883 family membrane-anchored ribosome-binding protein